jgi:hypothetical protein
MSSFSAFSTPLTDRMLNSTQETPTAGQHELVDTNCKKRKNESGVWIHFTEVKGPNKERMGKCIYCKDKLISASGTTNLWKHVKSLHGSKLGLSDPSQSSLKFSGKKLRVRQDKLRRTYCQGI